MSKKISLILILILTALVIGGFVFSKSDFSTTVGDNKTISIYRSTFMDTAQSWPIADEIVIKRKSSTLCGNIVVHNPSARANTETAIKRCYFEVAERLRDKAVCGHLQNYSSEDVSKCRKNIDKENARDFATLKRFAENIMPIQILKKDQGKSLTQFIEDSFEPHFKSTILTDKEREYGHDLEIILPKTITSSGEYKILVKLVPQNVEAEYTISIDNPYKINLPQSSEQTIQSVNSKTTY